VCVCVCVSERVSERAMSDEFKKHFINYL
jgi:hypothetical protein